MGDDSDRYMIIEIELGVMIVLFLVNMLLDLKRYNNKNNNDDDDNNGSNGNNKNTGHKEYKEYKEYKNW